MELKLNLLVRESAFSNTFNRTLWNWNYLYYPKAIFTFFLLIVPYGIETKSQNVGITDADIPFNRTLWNWNY